MFGEIISLIAARVKSTGLFSDVHPLARIVSDGNSQFPVIYSKDGQYTPLAYDMSNGMAYFRKRSQISYRETKEEMFQVSSCTADDVIYSITVPLRLVCFLNISKADCDNSFNSDFFAEWITSDISGPVKLSTAKARLVSAGYETDSIAVLKSEYSKPPVDINYNYSYFYIDFDLEIIADSNCLSSCFAETEELTGEESDLRLLKFAQTPKTNAKYGLLAGLINGVNTTFYVPEGKFKRMLYLFNAGDFTTDYTEDKSTGKIITNFFPTQLTAIYL